MWPFGALLTAIITAAVWAMYPKPQAASQTEKTNGGVSRRQWLQTAAAGSCAAALADSPASANGLVVFPPEKLNNIYILMRAGEGQIESTGIIRTNPVLATNINANGLTFKGRQQVIQGLEAIRRLGLEDEVVWIWPSITARCYQSAEILAKGLGVGQNRLVPEYVYLNARAFGSYENQPISKVAEVYAQDSLDPSIRPPRYTDGTPNESVKDVFVRGVQLISKLEAQYYGVTVILVAPDSDNLSILQAGLTGVDLRQHYQLAYAPGEARVVNLTPFNLEGQEDA
jgi:broad specificity phosphatase PhoE